MDAYLIYHINEGLGIIPSEVSDHLDLIRVREDRCYQRSALVHGKGIADQLFPGGKVATQKDTVKLTDVRSPEWVRD